MVGKGSGASQAAPAVRRGGRKGEQQDLSHLLGFTYSRPAPPSSTSNLSHLPRRHNNRNRSAYSGGGGGSGYLGRGAFVHTFRYVVKPDGDYVPHLADPDLHLDWEDILQVLLPVGGGEGGAKEQAREGGKPACPICLSEPTAGRMTKCGHTFCYPCVLHYLALADPGIRFRKCPVCHDSIYAKDLKPIGWLSPTSCTSSNLTLSSAPLAQAGDLDPELLRALELSTLSTSPSSTTSSLPHRPPRQPRDRLTFTLLRRPPASILALPLSPFYPTAAQPVPSPPWNFTPSALSFAKFLLGEPSYIREQLLAQLAELEKELEATKGMRGTDEQLGVVFLKEAIRRVQVEMEATDTMKTTGVMTARKRAFREIEEIEQRAASGTAATAESSDRPAAVEAAIETAPPIPPVDDTPIPMEFLAARAGAGGSGASTPIPAPKAGLAATARSFQPCSPPNNAPAATSSSLPSASHSGKREHARSQATPASDHAGASPADSDDSYYFYQSSSGSPVFLTPLDTRVLRSHFAPDNAPYSSMPASITVSVEGRDTGSVTHELRKRCKWLSHLPLGGEATFVEADLSFVIPRSALKPFDGQLRSRRQKRRERERKDDKAAREAEEKAKDAIPIYQSTYENGNELPLSWASQGTWEDTAAFPAPPSTMPSRPATSPPAPSSSSYSRPSFASALHATHSSSTWGARHDEDEFDAWGSFEEELGRRRAAPASPLPGEGSGGRETPSVNGGEAGGGKNGGKRGRKKGITLNLTGGARG
ncbi:hypothetical protein JCM11641_001327 [Rhodosporidiobolus odoratus]